jgi:hypothetical protein
LSCSEPRDPGLSLAESSGEEPGGLFVAEVHDGQLSEGTLVAGERDAPVEDVRGLAEQRAFYRLRQASTGLFHVARAQVKPATTWPEILPTRARRHNWQLLHQATGPPQWPKLTLWGTFPANVATVGGTARYLAIEARAALKGSAGVDPAAGGGGRCEADVRSAGHQAVRLGPRFRQGSRRGLATKTRKRPVRWRVMSGACQRRRRGPARRA